MIGLAADEIVVDNFAGGGGASTGIEAAIGRPIDIAINHDPQAIAMHVANHPHTRHLCENVWKVDIKAVVAGRRVGLAWFSPDCKHFSKAKGGKPVSKKIRGLAWVALKWAGLVKPRVIILENVEEFQTWGPLVNGRPCPRRRGATFKRWVTQLRNLGYEVDWRELRACDYGAPTIRKRLFIVARCDGQPIVWPDPTHGPGLLRYRTAAECIDWSLPCPSIFLTREEGRRIGVNRPLAEATMARIARGVKRYVIDAAEPFIVPIAHYNGRNTVQPTTAPLRTITASPNKGGSHALVVPTLIQTGYGEREGQAPRVPGLDKPLGTVVAGGTKHAVVSAFLSSYYGDKRPSDVRGGSLRDPVKTQPTGNRHALVAAFLAQHNAGPHNDGISGRSSTEPLSSITASGAQQQVVASHMVKLRGTCRDGQRTDAPLATISAQGTHLGEVRAFLMKYYGTDQDPQLQEPLHTITAKHRFGLVTVHGEDYVIVDIGMRMLTPRELFRAQGFPASYIIDAGRDICRTQQRLDGADWIELTKEAQVRMCGNSVSPPPAEALVRAQFGLKARAAAA